MITSCRLRLAELLLCEPLQVEEILHLVRPIARKAIDGGRSRIAVFLGPAGPTPVLRTLEAKIRIERIEYRVELQGLAESCTELPECIRAGRPGLEVPCAEMLVQELQRLELRTRYAGIVHVRGGTQFGKPGLKRDGRDQFPCRCAFRQLWHVVYSDIQHVEKLTTRWAVRADVRGVGWHEGMQRVEADDPAAERCGKVDELAQVAEVAHAPVALRTQRIQLNGETPDTMTRGNHSRLKAALGCNDES